MTDRVVLRGQRVILRPPHRRDKHAVLAIGFSTCFSDEYRQWINPRAAKGSRPTPADIDGWYQALRTNPRAWVIEVAGCTIGSAALTLSGDVDGAGVYSIGILDPAQWNRGYGTETTELVLHYAFEQLGLGAVGLWVRATNRRAIACYTKCGFFPLQMARDGGRSYVVMCCANPRQVTTLDTSPELVIFDLGTLRRTGQIALRPRELAYLGVIPGEPVTTTVEDGTVIVRPVTVNAQEVASP